MSLGQGYIAKAHYDFNLHGGSVGTITLDQNLPVGAKVSDIWFETVDTLTSGSGSVTVRILVGGTNISWNTTYNMAMPFSSLLKIPNIFNRLVPVTTAGPITLEIVTNTITAGKLNIYVKFNL